MNIIKMMFAAVVLVAVLSCADAGERRTYPCHRLTQAPVVDGKTDDKAWENIPEATGFYVYGGGEKYAVEKQTYFKAGWTDDAVYLAVRLEENTPEKIVATAKNGLQIWREDSIELFFLPSGAPTYTQLTANSVGSRGNKRERELDVMDWDAKATVGKTEWGVELRIPFAVLMAKTPKEGDEWPVNLARNLLTGPADERFSSWPLLKKNFHDVPNFGRFVFKGMSGDKVADEEQALNGSYFQDLHEKIRKLAGRAAGYRQDLINARKSENQRVEAENLLAIWDQVAKLAAQSAPDWRELMAARHVITNLPQHSDDCVARMTLEMVFKD